MLTSLHRVHSNVGTELTNSTQPMVTWRPYSDSDMLRRLINCRINNNNNIIIIISDCLCGRIGPVHLFTPKQHIKHTKYIRNNIEIEISVLSKTGVQSA